jgi:hypothetical protein
MMNSSTDFVLRSPRRVSVNDRNDLARPSTGNGSAHHHDNDLANFLLSLKHSSNNAPSPQPTTATSTASTAFSHPHSHHQEMIQRRMTTTPTNDFAAMPLLTPSMMPLPLSMATTACAKTPAKATRGGLSLALLPAIPESTPSSSSVPANVKSNTNSSSFQEQEEKVFSPQDYAAFAIYSGIPVQMALPDDKYWLSDIQCYVRQHCTELFAATTTDAISRKCTGRSRGVDVGQVGVRCRFCCHLPMPSRAPNAVSFPTRVSGLCSATVMMQCRHLVSCPWVPEDIKIHLLHLRQVATNEGSDVNSNSNANACPSANAHAHAPSPFAGSNPGNLGGNSGRQQYWLESAKKLGLIDTPKGIRFQRDPRVAARAIITPSPNKIHKEFVSLDIALASCAATTPAVAARAVSSSSSPVHHEHDPTLPSSMVSEEDSQLIPDYLFVAISQMTPCRMTEQDRVGCYKDRQVGFPGMCCRHCGGVAGFGRYFPASVRSLAQTTTSQTILKHVGAKCKRCPQEVRDNVLKLQEEANQRSAKEAKPKYGSRKVFFQRLWGRLHGENVPHIHHLTEVTEALSTSSSSLPLEKQPLQQLTGIARRAGEVSDSDSDDGFKGQGQGQPRPLKRPKVATHPEHTVSW